MKPVNWSCLFICTILFCCATVLAEPYVELRSLDVVQPGDEILISGIAIDEDLHVPGSIWGWFSVDQNIDIYYYGPGCTDMGSNEYYCEGANGQPYDFR